MPAGNRYSPRFSAPRWPSSSAMIENSTELSMTPAFSSWSAIGPSSSSRVSTTTLSSRERSGAALREQDGDEAGDGDAEANQHERQQRR